MPKVRIWRRKNPSVARPSGKASPSDSLREFAYLDEVSVQSLLVSLIGELPAEVTSLTSRSNEAEIGGTIGASAPILAKAELTSRFKGSATTSNQVLSRAVAESLFKHLYELVSDRLVWPPRSKQDPQPISLERGNLIEVEVQLAPDPIYGFNATMGVLTDIADDYPALVDDKTTALIITEAGLVSKLLERLMVGLIPLKSEVDGLCAGEVDGVTVAAPREFFEATGVACTPISVVGVTEQAKYWRDVRRVLFSKSRFTVLGRVSRTGVQPSWTPVKLTEVMRDIAPQFPDAITRVGRIGYSAPVNAREESNRDALERAPLHFALAVGGVSAASREGEIKDFARSQRTQADTLTHQGAAFDALVVWMVESGFISSAPEDVRQLRAVARVASGLKTSSEVTSLADFVNTSPPEEPAPEALIDLEIIAIYW